jgi:hypothetical protein
MEIFKNSEGLAEVDPLKEFEGKKMTKARLHKVLEALNLNYSIIGEGSDFEIIINPPEGYVEEKDKLYAGKVLNEGYHTTFDTDGLTPLIRAIGRSSNLGCNVQNEGAQWRVQVFRK